MLPPPPITAPSGEYAWLDWYSKLTNYLNQTGSIPWNVIDFSGSNISSIQQRDHNVLTSIQGGNATERYHLTFAQWSSLPGSTAEPANTFLAGPTSGGAAIPTWRNIVAADLPSISSGLTGTLPIANGGTGATTPSAALAALGGISAGTLINVQVFTSSGTYVPTTGCTKAIVEGVGGGGAGGGTVTNTAGNFSVGAGGGSGAYFKHFISSPTTTSVTVGSGGTGVVGVSGNAGTASAFGTINAPGGTGGIASISGATARATGGAGGATATNANIVNSGGQQGGHSFVSSAAIYMMGAGGNTPFGSGGGGIIDATGNAGTGYGSGGGGVATGNATSYAGGAGKPGVIIVYEYK